MKWNPSCGVPTCACDMDFNSRSAGAVLGTTEYVAALQMIAQANDAQQSNQYFSTALAAGLAALKESSDFVRQNPRKPHTDVTAIVGRHRTPILKEAAGKALTPRAAAERYYTYAQEQLATAAAGETTGAMALFGLGKVAIDPAGNRGSQTIERTAQAMALYQASLLADPRNYRAANELGVLVADSGGLERARDLFLKTVSLSPQTATWRNLAVVHSRLGEKELADAAGAQAAKLEKSGMSASGPAVKWVDPATFSRHGADHRQHGADPRRAPSPRVPQARRRPSSSPLPPRQMSRPRRPGRAFPTGFPGTPAASRNGSERHDHRA